MIGSVLQCLGCAANVRAVAAAQVCIYDIVSLKKRYDILINCWKNGFGREKQLTFNWSKATICVSVDLLPKFWRNVINSWLFTGQYSLEFLWSFKSEETLHRNPTAQSFLDLLYTQTTTKARKHQKNFLKKSTQTVLFKKQCSWLSPNLEPPTKRIPKMPSLPIISVNW